MMLTERVCDGQVPVLCLWRDGMIAGTQIRLGFSYLCACFSRPRQAPWFEIDRGAAVFCGVCVRVCVCATLSLPRDALRLKIAASFLDSRMCLSLCIPPKSLALYFQLDGVIIGLWAPVPLLEPRILEQCPAKAVLLLLLVLQPQSL